MADVELDNVGWTVLRCLHQRCCSLRWRYSSSTLVRRAYEECESVSDTEESYARADTTRKLEKQNRVRCPPDELPETVRTFAFAYAISEDTLRTHFDAGWSVAKIVFTFIQTCQPPKSSWNDGVGMSLNMPRNMSSAALIPPPPSRLAVPPVSNVRIIAKVTTS